MMPEVFDTNVLPAHEQYEGWRAWSLPLLNVTSQGAINEGFCAENRVWKLDEGLLASQITVQQRLSCDRRD
jgi:hypothetical protein